MKRSILAISVFGLLFSQILISGISYAAPALDKDAKSGFEKGIKNSGGSAQQDCVSAGGKVQGDKCLDADGNETDAVSLIIQNVINILLYIIGIIAVIYILIGGIRYVLSNGDASATKKARDNILYALVGLVVAVLAYAIVNFVLDKI